MSTAPQTPIHPSAKPLCELAESRGSDVMAELLQPFGLGPRKCRDCGVIFAVPPYMECKDWSLCEP